MINYTPFIVKDGDTFYFDVEDYNNKSDVAVEHGDVIKFTYDGDKKIAKALNIGSEKNKFFILEILKK